MARKNRVCIPGGLHQVIIQGNNGERLFREDEDYERMYSLLEEGVGRFGHQIHGFSCRTSEATIVIREGETSLSVIMHNLCFRYAMWFNRKYGRTTTTPTGNS